MVPSGRGLPLQSRIGSVCTLTLPELEVALMRSPHASEATWRITRGSETSPTAATTCHGPCLAVDPFCSQAMPRVVVCLREKGAVPANENRNSTGDGTSTVL